MSGTLHLSTPGPPAGADACAVCRSPLGAEQRYCLQCGARRDGARLEFLDVLAEPASPPRPAGQTILDATPRPRAKRWLTDGSVLGGAVVLVGTLLAGLLIGHWAGGSGDSPQASTQVIRLVGAGGLAADAGAGAAQTADAAVATTAKKAKAKTKAKAKAANTFQPDAAPVEVTPESEAAALNDTSGTEDLAPKDDDPNGANFDEIK